MLVLGLLASAWSQNKLMESQSVILHNDGISQAELIGPDHPGFAVERSRLLLQAGTHDLIEQHRTRSVLLHNKRSIPIVNYTVRWNIAGTPGMEPNFFKYSKIVGNWRALDVLLDPSVPENQQRIWLAKYNSIVPANGVRLMSPFFDVSADSMIHKYGLMPSFAGHPEFERQFPTTSRIDVTLDSVLYSDGLCEGPDTLDSCARFAADIEAAQSLIRQVNQSQQAGESTAAILDRLIPGPVETPHFPGLNASHADLLAYYTSLAKSEAAELRATTGDNAALARILKPQVAGFVVHKAGQ